jgi:hypothetical protein
MEYVRVLRGRREFRVGFCWLASGYGSENDEGFLGGEDGFGERCVGGEVGPVFFADEEAKEGAALFGGVVADGAAEHGVAGL